MIVGIRIPKRVHLYLSVSGTKVGTEQKMREGMLRKLGMDMYTVIFKMGNQQGPPMQRRGLCSMLCVNLDGRGFE